MVLFQADICAPIFPVNGNASPAPFLSSVAFFEALKVKYWILIFFIINLQYAKTYYIYYLMEFPFILVQISGKNISHNC